MSLNINFDYIAENGTKLQLKKTNCFSLFYSRLTLKTFKEINVYIYKDYGTCYTNKMNYSLEDVQDYVKYLNKIYKCLKLTVEDDKYKFTIINSNVLMTKIMLNMTRYLHETPYIKIPGYFLDMCRDPKLSYINCYKKMILCHYNKSNTTGGGHDILPSIWSSSVVSLLTIKKAKQFIEDNKECKIHYVQSIWIKEFLKRNLLEDIRNLVSEKSYKEAYIMYLSQFKPVKVPKVKKEIVIKKGEIEAPKYQAFELNDYVKLNEQYIPF